MSYIVSFFAALNRPSTEQRDRHSEHPTKEELVVLYYSPISPRLI